MSHRACVALLSFLAVAPSNSVSMSVVSGLNAGDAERSDHILRLQPPENTAHDIEASLAAIVKAEREQN
jgi:hypothetical protein